MSPSRALALVSSMLVLSACKSDPKPPSDAPERPRDVIVVDATPACAMPGECPCFSNDECPDGTRCHAEDPEHVYCTPGPRGTGAAGSPCTGENDCESALCVDGTDMMRCSKTCTDSNQCPSELPRCLDAIGICARNP